jgi:DMSO/TMAO reductase YedYZ molybdopterin-dependent catalytic subunit
LADLKPEYHSDLMSSPRSMPTGQGFAALVLVACLSCGPVMAQTNATVLTVRGAVEQPLSLTTVDLQAMPRAQIKAREKTAGEAAFEGVALYDVVMRAKPRLTERCCSNAVNTLVIIRAADNYQAIFSLPELDPKFGHEQIVLADMRNGQPLGATNGPLQFIVPADAVHARWVRQVNSIEILPLGDRRETSTNSLSR